ncbi:MAG TPA: histidine--tRNA ligase, partial [Marinobacter sp.]|nr:histidine--tRNA ligase [Marinobacter sp.]
LLLETLDLVPESVNGNAHIYVAAMGEGTAASAFRLAEMLREALPGRVVITHCGGGSFKSQMKKADRSGAEYALILGENEVASGTVSLKPLRSGEDQQEVAWRELPALLRSRFGNE